MIGSFIRLIKTGFLLLREDVLIPRELSHHLNPVARFFAATLRFFFARRGPQPRVGLRYARAFESLGPAFIKLGQVLSTRGDIFGDEFIRDLAHLKDQLPPFDQATAKRLIEEALEQPVESIFIEFGEVIGAASIAQAHRAILKDGRKVAVKVLRPRIEQIIADDIAMMTLAAKLIAIFAPATRRLEPEAFVATVAQSLLLELDLRLEASAADELGAIINAEPYMSAPKIVWHYVAKRALVIEWAPGIPLSRPEALTQPGLEPKAMADNLIRAFLSQALNHGVFHADLHEGNLFCQAPDKLTAIDFGIVGRLKPPEQLYLAEMLWGFLRRNYRRVAEVHFEAGYVPKHHDVAAFAQALRAVGEPVLGRAATEVSMGRLLGQLFDITAQFDMHLRPELVLLQKTMVSVEGVARRLYPEHDIWEAARPVVEQFITKELSPLAEARRLIDKVVARLKDDEPKADPLAQLQIATLRAELSHSRTISTLALIASALALGTMVWMAVF
ncbi:2-polyprenylphenol 6-hydroxylase [Asticcacaulis sp. YBE204]|uniref:2-polyprenylphenol 6-hydroxylase n=1 Tax=Asticcacaulis sp. YBE204 TaxID=1282363 RepID=UPI0003C3BA9B|nr:2-polyprenylphenol 6-hydroxylase [Asticcacaulis sp. YBE204]ESQ80957.1 ubiquinone biosynthesis protein [Asticcacaulis sp. YBE204]